MIDKHPALIARCAGAVDVINAVNLARADKQIVAVRGGGHNVAGNAVCDGGIVIDLVELNITAGNTIAFCYALLRIGSGDEPQCRLTIGLQKAKGKGLIAHEHHSSPSQVQGE